MSGEVRRYDVHEITRSSLSIPKTIASASFSVNKKGTVRLNRSNAKHLYQKHLEEPDVDFDLNAGLDSFKNVIATSDVEFQSLCRWLMQILPRGSDIKQLCGGRILCSCGILKKIAATPDNATDAWSFYAVKMNDIIFLCERVRKAEEGKERREYEKRSAYWEQKFKQHMRFTSKNRVPKPNVPVVIGSEYYMVVETALTTSFTGDKDPIRLAICGEVDCLDNVNGKAVVLKTTRCSSIGQETDAYIEGRLLGVSSVVFGETNAQGRVKKVVKVPLGELNQPSGYGTSCERLNYLHSTLLDVNSLLKMNRGCFVEKLRGETTVHTSTSVSSKDLDFLPAGFKEHFNLV